jgi:hypothetical protein
MEPILQVLDAQWPMVATSPEGRRALIRWAREHEALAGMHDLHDVLGCRRDPGVANEVHQVLVRHAPDDQLAARTLLQILLPGLVRLVGTVGRDDPDAPDELVAMAWERISTYPTSRPGSVAANVVLDVRKRYVKLRRPDRGASLHLLREAPCAASLPEDQVLAAMQLDEILDARRRGIVSPVAFDAIVRTRLGGESLAAVAADGGFTTAVMCQRRWRAEQRLRSLPLAG